MNLKNHRPAVISMLTVVAVAALCAPYLLTLPKAETHRTAIATTPAATSNTDEAAQAAAERYVANSETKFNRADKRGHASDALIDACTGKRIKPGAPVKDIASKADCTLNAPRTPLDAPRTHTMHKQEPAVVHVTVPPADPLKYCGDRGTCPLTDRRARSGANHWVVGAAAALKADKSLDVRNVSWHVDACDRQSATKVACHYVIKDNICIYLGTVEVVQPNFQHALMYRDLGGRCT